MVIRPATPEDLPQIVRMAGSFLELSDYHRFLTFDPQQVHQFASYVLERAVLFVAQPEDGPLCGFIAGVHGEEPIAATKMLDELAWWVDPEYRSGRTGLKLWGAYEEWARQNGVEALTMKAPHGSQVSRFYERLGFEAVETVYFKRLA